MHTIWKFSFPVADDVVIQVPQGTRLLPHVEAPSHATVEVWGEVPDTDAPRRDVLLRVRGTGHPWPEGWKWLGTVKTGSTPALVWHVFALASDIAR